MNGLARLQRAFAVALEEGRDADAALAVRGAGVAPEARVAFYRESLRIQRHDALAATYPVVRRLVGEAFFRAAAGRYAAAHPSRSGDLNLYGDAFAEFLAGDAPARALPYLPDVARLEWAIHESARAADAGPLDGAALAAVPAERQPAVRLALHPSVRLVASGHPIAAIRAANLPPRDGTMRGHWHPERVFVHREASAVRVRVVDAAEWALVEALRGGATLEEAVQAMGEEAARSRLADTLARLAAEGAIAGFSVAADRA
ncbi:MAG TPA: DNA-binding domain-containing protein [Usitatibacter sp.]|nr:DNA-binding domain-containing protein [Usitatibacter sp.]